MLLISQFCLPLIWRSSGKWSIEPPFFRVRLVIIGPGFFPLCQTDQPETRETNQWEIKRSHVVRLKQNFRLDRSLLRTFRPKFRLLHCEQGEKTRIFSRPERRKRKYCPRRDFAKKAKCRGGTLVTRAYIKESTYSWNIQSYSQYRKNLDLLEQGPRGIGR